MLDSEALPCLGCGYDLRGHAGGGPVLTCPECGRRQELRDIWARQSRPHKPAVDGVAAALVLAGVGVVGAFLLLVNRRPLVNRQLGEMILMPAGVLWVAALYWVYRWWPGWRGVGYVLLLHLVPVGFVAAVPVGLMGMALLMFGETPWRWAGAAVFAAAVAAGFGALLLSAWLDGVYARRCDGRVGRREWGGGR